MWYVVAFQSDANPDEAVWTVSEHLYRLGWRTQGGEPGYGLTKQSAEYIVKALNAYEKLSLTLENKVKDLDCVGVQLKESTIGKVGLEKVRET